MYMRNNSYNKYAKYSIDDFPPNYSGQYTKESLRNDDNNDDDNIFEKSENVKSPEHQLHNPHKHKEPAESINKKEEHREKIEEEPKESKEKRSGSLLGNLFGGHKDGEKGGLLSRLFNRGDDKEGGIFSNIELEDLILLAVIFFLLKDGFEDDMILILAIILFSS